MKILNKTIENREAMLTIELDPAEVEESLQKSYKKIVKRAEIPGFRKGKAPRSVLEQHLGKDGLLEDALKSLIPEAYTHAIKEQQIEPLAEPSIKLNTKDPVTFEAKIPLPPIVKIGDYHKIRIKPEKVNIGKDEINKIIEELQHRNATYKPVERPVQINDFVTIDVEGVVGKDILINKKATDYHVISGMAYPAPGFPEKLLKMKRDKEKKFSLKLPKNYHKKELAEKEAIFHVRIIEVKEEILPEVNDDFAKSLGPNIENVESLKKEIGENLKNSKEGKAMAVFEDKVIEALVEKSEIEYPTIMVDEEVKNLIAQYLQQLSMNVRTKSEYEKMLKNMPREELVNRYKPLATRRVESSLALEKVSEAEKIEVSDGEIDAEIERMVEDTGERKDEQRKYLKNAQNRDYIRKLVTTRKTVHKLVDIAKGNRKKNTKQKEAK
ncbi:MAG: trigger factor [Dehalococcoidia bacterium]|nr:MAG: trigger factor [Dehalococcoidia bacterium]